MAGTRGQAIIVECINVKSVCGFTLIEILVALFLSSLMMAGLMMVYLSIKSNYRSQNAWVSLQDRQRFAAYLFNRVVHQAGNAKCQKGAVLVDQQHAILGDGDSVTIGECIHYKNKNQFVQMNYFIDDTKRKDLHGHPIFALYRKPIHGEREELIAGISKMQIRYGVMTKDHHDVAQYISAEKVSHWENVRSVSLTLSLNYLNVVKLLHFYIDMCERG